VFSIRRFAASPAAYRYLESNLAVDRKPAGGVLHRAAREFQVFAKPAGAVCNLACQYCYYLDKRGLYPDAGPLRMTEGLLEDDVVQRLAAAPGPELDFSWHGGEPTIPGVEFFTVFQAGAVEQHIGAMDPSEGALVSAPHSSSRRGYGSPDGDGC
jgi:hypothetical protein